VIAYTVHGAERRASLWLPPGFAWNAPCALVVFLHAYEERGDDDQHLGVGIGPALQRYPALYTCPVLLPQCPRDRVWAEIDRPWADGLGSAEEHIDAAVEATLAQFAVDPGRIALTGASMGGFGTFLHGAHRPRYRALGPVCGGGRPEDAAVLSQTPVWAWHGSRDDVVPPDESRRMIAALRAAGAEPRYDEVDADHHVWDRAYADPDFARFLCDA